MLSRASAFHNVHSKLRLICNAFLVSVCLLHVSCHVLLRHTTVAGAVAEKWFVKVDVHIIRRTDYKGSREKHSLKLPFDGCTMPALIFLVT